ncbi:MAG: hypothetical protein AAGK04_02105 [Planctomycetota bacterium]
MPLKDRNKTKALDACAAALGIEDDKAKKILEDAIKDYMDDDNDDEFYSKGVDACKKARINGMNADRVQKALKRGRAIK